MRLPDRPGPAVPRSLRGLRVQLLLWAIAPLILIVVSVSILGIVSHQSAMRDLVAQRDAQLAGVAADLLDERLSLHFRLLETIADSSPPLPDLPEFDHGLLYLDAADRVISASPSEEAWAHLASRTSQLAAAVRAPSHPSGIRSLHRPRA